MHVRVLALPPVLLLPLCAEDDWVDHKSPSGAWTVKLPPDWKAVCGKGVGPWKEQLIFSREAPRRLIVIVQVASVAMSLKSLVEPVKGMFSAAGTKLENETDCKLDGRPALGFEVVVEEEGKKERNRGIVTLNGADDILVLTSSPEPVDPDDRKLLEQIVESFHLPDKGASRPQDFEERKFDSRGLSLLLPTGGRLTVDSEDSLRIYWEDSGLFFVATWTRTRLPPLEFAKYELEREAESTRKGEPTWQAETIEPTDVAGTRGCLAHTCAMMNGTRVLTVTSIYRSTEDGGILALGFARAADVPFHEFRSFEEKLLAAKVKPHFAALPEAIPEVAARVDVWGGRATIGVPKDWTLVQSSKVLPKDADEGPQVEHAQAWAARGARDFPLNAQAGAIKGGREAYEEWYRKRTFKAVDKAEFSPTRTIQVGGKEAIVLQAEFGHKDDRKVTCSVIVFDGDRYYDVFAVCPLDHKAALGGLAEKVAASVEWNK